MSRKWVCVVCLGLLALSITASAAVTDPSIISGAAKVSSLAEEDLVIMSGGLVNGAVTHVDRTFVFVDANDLSGIDFVMTAVDDKNNAALQYDVTVDKAGTLFLLVDNRVGDNEAATPPTLGSGVMDWVVSAGFTLTDYAVDFTDTSLTAYALPVTAGTYSLYQQADGTSRLTYLVAAIPAGWNLRPSISGLPASVKILPGETLDLNAVVTDYGENTTTTVLWEQISGAPVSISNPAEAGVTVTFPPGEGDYTLRITATDGDGLIHSRLVEVAVRLPQYALQAADFCEIANDSNTGPNSALRKSLMNVKNYNDGSAQRRRIGFHRYNIGDLKQEGKVFANTFITANADKGNNMASRYLYVYAIREELDAFTLNGTKWNTAPGVMNNPTPALNSEITEATLDHADIYPLLTRFQLPTVDIWHSSAPSIDLDEILNSDIDGTVVLMYVALDPESYGYELRSPTNSTIEPETGKKGLILRGNVMTATWAHAPKPRNFSIVGSDTTQLRWTNPLEPVGSITCDVYFGTDPNAMLDHHGLPRIAQAISGNSVTIPYALTQHEDYYWIVDIYDDGKTPQLTAGNLWTFNTSNAPAVVSAGDDQYIWLNNAGNPAAATVTLNGSVTDDGMPDGILTSVWTQTAGEEVIDANSVIIATQQPANTPEITLVLPKTGTYRFTLTGNDGTLAVTDIVQVVVAETPCLAAQKKPNYKALTGDLDNDCYVDLRDLAIVAAQWLQCSSLAPCF